MNSVNLAVGVGKLNGSLSTSRHSVYSHHSANSMASTSAITVTKRSEAQKQDKETGKERLVTARDPVQLRTLTVEESFRRLEELSGAEVEETNWKGIVIALLVIATILAAITVAIVIISPKPVPFEPGPPFNFLHLINPDLKVKQPVYNWVPGKDAYIVYMKDVNEINQVDPSSPSITDSSVIVPSGILDTIAESVDEISLSMNMKTVLIKHGMRDDGLKSTAFFHLYSLDTYMLHPIPSDGRRLLHATFLGDQDKLVYIVDNNLYYKSSASAVPVVLTTDGGDNVLNGIPDLLYRTHIMPERDALVWPHGGSAHFIFAKISKRLNRNTVTPPSTDSVMPSSDALSLHVYDGFQVRRLSSHVFSNGYLASVGWGSTNTILVSWLDDSQQNLYYLTCEVTTGQCQQVFTYSSSQLGLQYAGLYGDWLVNEARSELYAILPDPSNPKQLYRHVVAIQMEKDERTDPIIRFLTSYAWSDVRLIGLSDHKLYYMSTGPHSIDQHLFGVDITSGTTPDCITCNMSFSNSLRATFIDVRFSSSFNYVAVSLLGPDIPSTHIVRTSRIRTDNLTELTGAHLLDGAHYHFLHAQLDPIRPTKVKYTTIPLEQSFYASVRLILPPVWRESQIYLYPLLIVLADQPDQMISNSRFTLGFYDYLAYNNEYIIAQVDLRGSAHQGELTRQAIHGYMGLAESTDLQAVIEYMIEYSSVYKVNSEQIAVIGRAYGGYASLHSLRKPHIKCGVVISPLAQIKKDEYFGDRYTLDSSIPLIYDCDDDKPLCSIPLSDSLLVVHGTEDNQISINNSLNLMRLLQNADYQFRLQLFPEAGHDLEKSDVAPHYYRTITNYLEECFSGSHFYQQLP